MITFDKIEIDKKCVMEVGNKRICYNELEREINRISNRLQNIKGLVAIYVRRRDYYIVCALAAIKVGVAFVPLNVDDPFDRINYILNRCNIKTVMCCEDSKPFIKGMNFIYIDSILNSSEDVINCGAKHISVNDTMYILFTSGSTGQPKGVEVTRENFIAFSKGICKSIKFEQDESILFHTNVTFDINLLETIVALCIGLRVVVMADDEYNNVRLIKKVLTEEKVDILQITPSKLQLLINEDKNLNFLHGIRKILVGGEVFTTALFNKLKEAKMHNNHNLKIYNVYGPTETTIWSTVSDITEEDEVTVGNPIYSVNVYLLDEEMNIIKEAEKEGEIFISGKVVAKGYINEPLLTNEKFVLIKDCAGRNVRGFLTGDLGMWNSRRQLVCSGRKDNMVKVNGYRIELEEIEIAMAEVSEGGIYIVSKYEYEESSILVVCHNKKELEVAQLKEKLKKKLPTYMIPDVFLYFDSFPYTSNFKIDRKKLQESIDNSIRNRKNVEETCDKEDDLLSIIMRNIATKDVVIDGKTILKELGISSIAFIKIIVLIEEQFDIEFDDDKLSLNAFEKYEDLVHYVISKKHSGDVSRVFWK